MKSIYIKQKNDVDNAINKFKEQVFNNLKVIKTENMFKYSNNSLIKVGDKILSDLPLHEEKPDII